MKTATQINLQRVGEIKPFSNSRRREGESQLASRLTQRIPYISLRG